MRETKFVTLYPPGGNAGLMKDVGQIPNTLGKMKGIFSTKLVNCNKYSIDTDLSIVEGVTLETIPLLLNSEIITGLLYILKNAKSVDWFNFYHGGRRVYYWTKLYKLLNPKGKVYLKMDLGYDVCEKCSNSKRERHIFCKTAEAVDLISVESEEILNRTKEFCNVDIKLIPNGYFNISTFQIKPISERDKCFIVVSRLGTLQKATDLLLKAFADSADKHDWSLKLLGPVEKSFESYIEEYFNKYPELVDRVKFVGTVYDKRRLYEEYNRARVFVLPSRWEGFPLVGPEALYCGCRMILSDAVPPFRELTNNGIYGITTKTGDIDSLSRALVEETQRQDKDDLPFAISDYAKAKLSWDVICEQLYLYMSEVT